ncbi:MAG: hypothetical protein HKN23_10440 [Verrucomicrobiales bacterium]|nr:hypothetical protein [Verrucomicrobiales bacterium]
MDSLESAHFSRSNRPIEPINVGVRDIIESRKKAAEENREEGTRKNE